MTQDLKPSWQDQVYDLLRASQVTQFGYVPDGGLRRFIDRAHADPGAHAVSLTTEEEGVGLAAGADLGGQRAVLMMQSSGVGNCPNLLGLVSLGRFPFLSLVTMRGDFGEGNPWQFPAGGAAEALLHAVGIRTLRADREDEVVDVVSAALLQVWKGNCPTAVLLTQRLLGAKAF